MFIEEATGSVIMKDPCIDFITKFKVAIATLSLSIIGTWLLLTLPINAFSGKYLVAKHAAGNYDFKRAAKSYMSIIDQSVSEEIVIQEALIFSVLANDLEAAGKLSMIVERRGLQIPSAGLVSLADIFKNRDFKKAYPLLSQYQKVLPTFLISLSKGWSEIANGNFEIGIKIFSSLDAPMRYLGLYNCAVAYAMRGDFNGALLYVNELEDKKLQLDARQLRAVSEIYSNNNENIKAILFLESQDDYRNSNIFKTEIEELKNGKRLKFEAIETPADALSSIFYLIGNMADTKKKNPIASTFYIQLAESISSEKDYYNIRLAEIFAEMQVFNFSIEKYNKIGPKSAFYVPAQLGIVDALVETDKHEQAKLVLQRLIKDGFDQFEILDSLADIFRNDENYEKAIEYYNRALTIVSEETKVTKWATFFVRGIAHDQSGNWNEAKVDLEIALDLYPNHPEVLNYLGYSLIERNENLVEALDMIKSAASQKPGSGYIIDSLAWGLFRLGQYNKAIIPMERAILLEPHDPIVNDHLGDVLWMIGRKREAAFQWKRALLFSPTLQNEKKIREKLKLGITDLSDPSR